MSKLYSNYTVEEFIIDDDFIRWVKYPTEESDSFWQSFLNNQPAQTSTVRQARLAVQQLVIASKQAISTGEIPVIWTDIETHLKDQSQHGKRSLSIHWSKLAAAASVILALGLGYWWAVKPAQNSKEIYSQMILKTKSPLKEVINNSASKQAIIMSDGSKVVLEPNSRLSYSESFEGANREVYLLGEAFFEVERNPKKPFLVYANGLIAKVLGTSFWVKAYEKDQQVTVLVKTGKVSVFSNKIAQNPDPETAGVVLTPNQKVVFEKEDARLTRTLAEKPLLILSARELQQFSFTNAPIAEIFRAFEKAYGVEIIFDEEVMTNCHLTTSLTNETLFEKLDIICEGIESSYKVVDAQVIISSKGCY
ncbi:MAG: FecR family protein [Cytophagia bacterium]|nr:MAG: FecR family protein [Cytophagales bacterium]TAG41348.1 MAG: FecR family protein [Cytophagia bacterium]TAG83106.1 MAG: FecR family protein [Cytophagales bacterium]